MDRILSFPEKQDSLALFGAAYGDEESDIVPVKESRGVLVRRERKAEGGLFLDSSYFGERASAHRVAFDE